MNGVKDVDRQCCIYYIYINLLRLSYNIIELWLKILSPHQSAIRTHLPIVNKSNDCYVLFSDGEMEMAWKPLQRVSLVKWTRGTASMCSTAGANVYRHCVQRKACGFGYFHYYNRQSRFSSCCSNQAATITSIALSPSRSIIRNREDGGEGKYLTFKCPCFVVCEFRGCLVVAILYVACKHPFLNSTCCQNGYPDVTYRC